jgi:hypothetical protein
MNMTGASLYSQLGCAKGQNYRRLPWSGHSPRSARLPLPSRRIRRSQAMAGAGSVASTRPWKGPDSAASVSSGSPS